MAVEASPASASWFSDHSTADQEAIIDYMYLRSGHASVPYPGDPADAAQQLNAHMSGLADNPSQAATDEAASEMTVGQQAGLFPATHLLAPDFHPDETGTYKARFVVGDLGAHTLYGELVADVDTAGWEFGSPDLLWFEHGFDIYFGATVQQSPGAYLFSGPVRWFDKPCEYSDFGVPSGAELQGGLSSTGQCVIPHTDPTQFAPIVVNYPYVSEGGPHLAAPLRPYRDSDGSVNGAGAPSPDLGSAVSGLSSALEGADAGPLRSQLDWGLGPVGAPDPSGGGHKFSPGPGGTELFGPGGSGADPNRVDCHHADPVNCATGNFSEAQQDLSIGGLGSLDLSRTYNAQAAATATTPGRFGYGWSDPFGQHLVIDSANNAVTVVDADGAEFPYYANGDGTYDHEPWVQASLRHNADGSYDYTLPDRSGLRFDDAGKLTAIVDRDDNATTVDHSPTGNVVDATAPGGRSIAFSYNADGTVASATSPAGREVEYGYTGGELTSVTDVRSGIWHFTYDSQHRLTAIEDPRANTTHNTYDDQSRVLSQTDRRGKTTTFGYQAGVTTVTDPTGSVTETTFVHNLPTKVVAAQGTNVEKTTLIDYDTANNPIAVTDPLGHVWHYGYDSAGNRTSSTDPLGHETDWAYDEQRDITSQTLPSGLKTIYDYDSHGNVTTITRHPTTGSDETTTMDYDGQGNLTSRTDPLDHAWTYTYNSDGDRTTANSPLGHETSFAHDDDGFVTATVSPRGDETGADPADFTTSYLRNAAGQPTTITDPLGHDISLVYDANGNLTSSTDRDGHETQTTYNEDDEPTSVQRPDGTTLQTGYDDAGRVISQTNGADQETTYARDQLGRVAVMRDPNNQPTTWIHDVADNVTRIIDAEGRNTWAHYDTANRLTDIEYPGNDPGEVMFTYTSDGQRATMSDDTGTTTYNHDGLDRLTSVESGHGQHVGYHYDLADRLTSIDYPDALVPGPPTGTPDTVATGTITRSYNADDQLTAVRDWLDHETTFAYNPDGALTSIQRPDGTTDAQSVDRNDQLTAIDDTGSAFSFHADYTRTDQGLLASATETGDPAAPDATYSHDDNGRLTGSGAGNQAYAYDDADNPSQLIDGTDTRNQTFDPAGHLTRIADATNDTLATLGFDNEGRRLSLTPASGTATTYSYNNALNLTQYSGPDSTGASTITQTYGYDGDGLRQYTETGGTRTYHAWDASSGLPLMIQDGATSYLYGPDDTPIEQITAAGQTRYYHQDQLGSTRALTDEDGSVLAAYSYTPYGALKATTGTATNPFRFAGQYTDITGLQYLRARYYDPATAQFLTRDPAVATTGQPYAYAVDEPTDAIDPTGRSPQLWYAPPFPGEPTGPVINTGNLGAPDPGPAINTGDGDTAGVPDEGYTPATLGPDTLIHPIPCPPASTLNNDWTDADEYHGLTPDEVGELVPDGWISEPSRSGGGIRYHPETPNGDQIRVMPGNPDDDDPAKRGPYVRISANGHTSAPIPLRSGGLTA